MQVNNIITLNNGDNYLLLEEILHENAKYFFCVRVDGKKTKPVNDYVFVKDESIKNKVCVKIIKENKLIEKLYDIILRNFVNS